MMKTIKRKNGYGAFEYVIVASFVLVVALIILTDTKGTIKGSSDVIRASFLEMFGGSEVVTP